MKFSRTLCCVFLFLMGIGCSSTNDESAMESSGDLLSQDYSAVEAEIAAWSDSLSAVCERLDLQALTDYHIYSEKFTRIENIPGIGAVRMDEVEGKKREDDYFGSLDQFEQSFSDVEIDVLGERHAIVTMRYEFQGHRDGKPIHEPIDTWTTLVIIKPENEWKIIYENLVVAD
jgi:hypothetical protein